MIRLYKRLGIICLFFVVYYAVFIRFDLYDFFGVRVKYFDEIENTFIMDESGNRVTKYNPFPTIKYINCLPNDKTYSVIYGDSKIDKIDVRNLAKIEGNKHTKWLNLSYGGCPPEESILEFYYTVKRVKLDKVIFELDSKALNTYYNMDRLSRVIDFSRWELYKSYFFDYYNNRMALETTLNYLKKKISKDVSIEDLRNQQDTYNKTIEEDRKATDVFEMNNKDIDNLIKIAKYCKENNIKLIFFSPPINGRLYDEVPKNYEILKQADRAKMKLSHYAMVYDMQYLSDISYMKDEWEDAWHYSDKICRIIENNLAGKNKNYMRIYENGRIIE